MEQKTPLYDMHLSLSGKMVPFAGYLLPVQYERGVIAEHMAVRKAAGLFDVSHMGEILLKGSDALKNIQNLVTNDCSYMKDGQVKYSPMCNENGGVVDDLLIYRYAQDNYLLVVNASNRLKDVQWIKTHLFGDVCLEDISDKVAQIALQGPASYDILSSIMNPSQIPTKYYTFTKECNIAEVNVMISKTGYTGELGYEIYLKNEDAASIWEKLLKAGKDFGLLPCGLGARDTLRLEAAMPLYGHEMSDSISPLETGLSFFVKLEKEDFIGKSELMKGFIYNRRRVGIKLTGRGIARENCPIYLGDRQIGYTTSGTHLPYLGFPAAMALIDCDLPFNEPISVEIRGKRVDAIIIDLPFYKSVSNKS